MVTQSDLQGYFRIIMLEYITLEFIFSLLMRRTVDIALRNDVEYHDKSPKVSLAERMGYAVVWQIMIALCAALLICYLLPTKKQAVAVFVVIPVIVRALVSLYRCNKWVKRRHA